MGYCKDCKHYLNHRTEGPTCTKGRACPTSPIAEKKCFEERPADGDAEVPDILATIPEAAPLHEGDRVTLPDGTIRMVAGKVSVRPGRGRKKEHENYVGEDGVLMKWCRSCQQYKAASEFYKKSGTPDGYAYECKQCRTEHQKDYRDRKREQEADMVRRLKEAEKLMEPDPDPVVEPEEEAVDMAPSIQAPDFDSELDKALYGDTIVREGDGVFLNFNGVFIPIVDWKSGSYGIKSSGLRKLAKYFFNLGAEAAK